MVELLFLADEGPSDAVLNVEDTSLVVETRDYGLETESVGLSRGALVLGAWRSGTFRRVEARDLKEVAEELLQFAGTLGT